MKTELLPSSGRYYKTNLHSHTNCSDGCLTPEEMKAAYREKGYSILAFSDHDHLRTHNELTEPDFLALTAYEISIRSDDLAVPHALRKVVDLNLIARTPELTTHVGYHPETVEWLIRRGKLTGEERDAIVYAGELRDLHYYPANINRIIRTANETGFLVMINHPMWSLIGDQDCACYEGAWAVEIYNHGAHVLSGLSDSESVWDGMLRSGKRLYAAATDDNHGLKDRFGGWIMVNAEKLDYPTVIASLEAGRFYASTGPEIGALYYEDGRVTIQTSEAAEICMNTLGRLGERAASADGSPITEASFDVDPERFGYVRFRVVDREGHKAYTNAYEVDSFMPGAKPVRIIV